MSKTSHGTSEASKSKTLVFPYLHKTVESATEYSVLLQDPDIPSWERDIYEFLSHWYDKNDHIVVHTSGSTGDPKPIKIKKSWMRYSAITTCNYFGLQSDSKALLCLPAAFIAGKMMIVRALEVKFDLYVCEPTGNPFKDITEKIDFAAVTPFQLYQSLDTLHNNSIVKTLIVGGGEIPATLEAQVRDLPVEIFATYGMTETSSHVALRKVNGTNPEHAFRVIGVQRSQQMSAIALSFAIQNCLKET
jgi:o-succinylbenzoate---CoA ligase